VRGSQDYCGTTLYPNNFNKLPKRAAIRDRERREDRENEKGVQTGRFTHVQNDNKRPLEIPLPHLIAPERTASNPTLSVNTSACTSMYNNLSCISALAVHLSLILHSPTLADVQHLGPTSITYTKNRLMLHNTLSHAFFPPFYFTASFLHSSQISSMLRGSETHERCEGQR